MRKVPIEMDTLYPERAAKSTKLCVLLGIFRTHLIFSEPLLTYEIL